MRGRGLKPNNIKLFPENTWSPSMRGRGLKPRTKVADLIQLIVALHAGAWIETLTELVKTNFTWVALHAGAWIETYSSFNLHAYQRSRPPCGGVD